MKKRYLLVIILVFAVFGTMLFFMPKPLQNYVPQTAEAVCYVYCTKTSLPSVSVGFGRIVKCSAGDLKSVISCCSGVDGVSLSFSATEKQFYEITEQCGFTFCREEKFENLITVCGYSPKLSGGIYIDGCKINLQAAYSGGTVYIGSPLILGSF